MPYSAWKRSEHETAVVERNARSARMGAGWRGAGGRAGTAVPDTAIPKLIRRRLPGAFATLVAGGRCCRAGRRASGARTSNENAGLPAGEAGRAGNHRVDEIPGRDRGSGAADGGYRRAGIRDSASDGGQRAAGDPRTSGFPGSDAHFVPAILVRVCADAVLLRAAG